MVKGGTVAKVNKVCDQEITDREKLFYLPHRSVINESCKAINLRIIYDIPPRQQKIQLEITLPLENLLWYILVKPRFQDTNRKNTLLNKTQALTKSMNVDIWVIKQIKSSIYKNQLFIRRSYTEIKFFKN